MEVERSMTTRKEDAESIIGEELAEELDEESLIVGKSEALVIKADEEELIEEGKHDKEMKKEDEEEDDEEEKDKKDKEKKSDVEDKSLVIDLLQEIKAELKHEPAPAHPLDIAISELKAVYDEALVLPDPQESLRMMQEPFEALAAVIQNGFAKDEVEEEKSESMDNQLAEVLTRLSEEVGMLRSELAIMKSQPQNQPQVPVRRSINPALLQKPQQEQKSETPKLSSLIRQSVGL